MKLMKSVVLIASFSALAPAFAGGGNAFSWNSQISGRPTLEPLPSTAEVRKQAQVTIRCNYWSTLALMQKKEGRINSRELVPFLESRCGSFYLPSAKDAIADYKKGKRIAYRTLDQELGL